MFDLFRSPQFSPQIDGMKIVDVPGRLTEMTCPCGGFLRETRSVAVLGSGPRPHRTKRIRKKWRKQWARQNASMIAVAGMMAIMQPPRYRCEGCGRVEGMYRAVGRNLIQVEQLPPGAWNTTPG